MAEPMSKHFTHKSHFASLAIGVLGMLVIAPDALLLRLVSAGTAELLWARGLLFGATILLFCFWMNRREWMQMLFSGVFPKLAYALSFAIGTVMFIYAIIHTKVFNVLVIMMTAPLLAALTSQYLRREPVEPALWLVSALVFACVTVIFWSSLESGNHLGDLAAFGVALSLALNANLVRHHRNTDMLVGLALGGLLLVLGTLPFVDYSEIGRRDWIWLSINNVIVLPIAMGLINYASKHLPSPELNLLYVIEMVFSPLLIWYFLDEKPSLRVLAAGSIACGILVVYYSRKLASSRKDADEESVG